MQDSRSDPPRKAHAAHYKFQKSGSTGATIASGASAPSQFLHADSPEVESHLEALDDAVFAAIQGDSSAMDALRNVWPELRQHLGDPLLAESREQYIRYALSIWQEPARSGAPHDPARAVLALEVLCVLFDDWR